MRYIVSAALLTCLQYTFVYNAASRSLRKEKKPQRRLMELSVCLEELMDTPTFKRFNTALDVVLEAAEDMDLASIRGVYISLLFRCSWLAK